MVSTQSQQIIFGCRHIIHQQMRNAICCLRLCMCVYVSGSSIRSGKWLILFVHVKGCVLNFCSVIILTKYTSQSVPLFHRQNIAWMSKTCFLQNNWKGHSSTERVGWSSCRHTYSCSHTVMNSSLSTLSTRVSDFKSFCHSVWKYRARNVGWLMDPPLPWVISLF